MRTRFIGFVLACLLPIAPAVAAGWVVPSGATVDVGAGTLDLARGSLDVAGTVQLGAGAITGVGDAVVRAGGTLAGGSGRITIHENWENRGSFNAGTGTVQFRDGMAAVNTILGGTTFHNLSIETLVGETYRFEAGSEQRVAGLLSIVGTGSPVLLASTVAGSQALLNLLPGGTQAISNVGVNGVQASGQHLAPTDSNQQAGGAAPGWFAAAAAITPAVIPAASPFGLVVLAGLMFAVAWRARRRLAQAQLRA